MNLVASCDTALINGCIIKFDRQSSHMSVFITYRYAVITYECIIERKELSLQFAKYKGKCEVLEIVNVKLFQKFGLSLSHDFNTK